MKEASASKFLYIVQCGCSLFLPSDQTHQDLHVVPLLTRIGLNPRIDIYDYTSS